MELLLILIVGVGSTALLYRILPFRKFSGSKPLFTFFPKYLAEFDCSKEELASRIRKLDFVEENENLYTRGKIYGDFSAKKIRLAIEINDQDKEIRVYATFFGVLFDTGDLWSITSDIVMPSPALPEA